MIRNACTDKIIFNNLDRIKNDCLLAVKYIEENHGMTKDRVDIQAAPTQVSDLDSSVRMKKILMKQGRKLELH